MAREKPVLQERLLRLNDSNQPINESLDYDTGI